MSSRSESPQPLAYSAPYCIHIHYANNGKRPLGWSVPDRRLEYWLLVTSLAGDERIQVAGTTYLIPDGTTYLIPPGTHHHLGSRRGSTPHWIHFDVLFDHRRHRPRRSVGYQPHLAERSGLLQPDARSTWGVDLPIVMPERLSDHCRQEVRRIIADFQRSRRGIDSAFLQATARLGLLLADIVADAGQHAVPATEIDVMGDTQQSPATMDQRLQRAEAIARQQVGTPFSIIDFARAAGLGRSRFCQLYQQFYRRAPGAFLLEARLERAEDLLRNTGLSVRQVAAAVGYRHPADFIRTFKRVRAATPQQWRTLQTAR